MATKKVEIVVAPREPHFVGDGFRVHNFIPGAYGMNRERMDPFIMLDYNPAFYFPPSEITKGVGVHPHRGFETVTIAYKGSIAHADSNGGVGVIAEGDVQWMTAASGILHKEYHEEKFSRVGGEFQMVQLWVNLPASEKMNNPKYQAISNKEIKRVDLGNGNGFIEVIAGIYKNVTGPASTFTPLNMMNAKLKKGGKVDFSFPADYTTALLVIEGNIRVNGENVVTDHFVLFEKEGETFEIETLDDAVVLVLSGKPIKEAIVSHGPFVMNTQQEIAQAFKDYNEGKFGYLE